MRPTTPDPDKSDDPLSRREVMRVRQYWYHHGIDQLMFDPSKRPGDVGYGAMYIGSGDGRNSDTNTDPYNQAQDPGVPLGKILRINPLRNGAAAYTIPPDNPFVGRAGYLPEIFAL